MGREKKVKMLNAEIAEVSQRSQRIKSAEAIS